MSPKKPTPLPEKYPRKQEEGIPMEYDKCAFPKPPKKKRKKKK